jgi:DNA-binding transcriptional LysR family regulator
MKLSGLDMNLLLVLHAVLEHGSVAAAARELHVTPSAVSNALARLRSALGDPLFVRRGRGLTATPRARELAPLLSGALLQLEQAVCAAERFDPATSTREFTIAMADGDQIASLPALAHAFMRALPRGKLHVISIDALIASGGLAGPLAELAIAPKLPDPELHWQPLYETDAVVLARRDHPRLSTRKRLTREQFCALRHVDTRLSLGRPGVGHEASEDMFTRAGLLRDVAITVPTFTAAALVAAHSDLLAALPRHVSEPLCTQLPLRLLELPQTTPRMPLGLTWHRRVHDDPATTFVRGLVLGCLRSRRVTRN